MKRVITTAFVIIINLSSFAQAGKVTLAGQVQNRSVSLISITDFNYQELTSG